MNTKKIFTLFSVSVLSALIAVIGYTYFVKPSPTVVEVPRAVYPAAQYTSLPSSSASQGQLPDLTIAAEKSIHSVVHVKTVSTQTTNYSGNPLYDFFFGPGMQMPRQQPVMGSGSGVIITTDGYIVTNNHVIEDATNIEVTLNDNRTFKAKMIGTDPATDIALIKIDATDLPYLEYGNSDGLKIGEWVLAVGNPFNLTSTVTAGIVSAKSRNINILRQGQGTLGIESFIQTDAAVNPGNSGGALVNTSGKLVGINTAIASQTGSYTGYSFAVPVSIVKKVVADLMEYGQVQRGVLGVSIRDVNSELNEELDLGTNQGAYVAEVVNGSGAEEAGIKKGDVIVSVENELVTKVSELQEKISRHRPGDKVNVTVIRDGKKKDFIVTLRNIYGSTDVVKADKPFNLLGASFEEVSKKEMMRLRISHGIKVTNVSAGKFREAGVQEGYIITKANRVPINSVEDLRKVVEMVEEGLFLSGIYPNGQVAYYAINLDY
ncbi:Do family serine endopeptidase [Thermophagus sp. OGC60D27]|uniref:Do family serine endopeptidase n=1 Tax=Thermophagus sp. OGC60D27 TaxID=3458415 RepID=UPI00403796ED